jgi:hypothetical protein
MARPGLEPGTPRFSGSPPVHKPCAKCLHTAHFEDVKRPGEPCRFGRFRFDLGLREGSKSHTPLVGRILACEPGALHAVSVWSVKVPDYRAALAASARLRRAPILREPRKHLALAYAALLERGSWGRRAEKALDGGGVDDGLAVVDRCGASVMTAMSMTRARAGSRRASGWPWSSCIAQRRSMRADNDGSRNGGGR